MPMNKNTTPWTTFRKDVIVISDTLYWPAVRYCVVGQMALFHIIAHRKASIRTETTITKMIISRSVSPRMNSLKSAFGLVTSPALPTVTVISEEGGLFAIAIIAMTTMSTAVRMASTLTRDFGVPSSEGPTPTNPITHMPNSGISSAPSKTMMGLPRLVAHTSCRGLRRFGMALFYATPCWVSKEGFSTLPRCPLPPLMLAFHT